MERTKFFVLLALCLTYLPRKYFFLALEVRCQGVLVRLCNPPTFNQQPPVDVTDVSIYVCIGVLRVCFFARDNFQPISEARTFIVATVFETFQLT